MFRSVGRTHVGAVRSCNEDSFIERTDAGLWAVSDGMGGHSAGDVASAAVVGAIGALPPPGDAAAGIVREALVKTNEEMYRRGSGEPQAGTMGATVAVLVSDGKTFTCLWAGDSRLYRFRGATLTRLTRDHRFIQDLLDSGILSEAAAEQHPKRHVITRAVGVDSELNLDMIAGEVEKGDIFLLATDGVTSVCGDAELAAILKASPDIADAGDAIVGRCLENGAPDNLTLILVARD